MKRDNKIRLIRAAAQVKGSQQYPKINGIIRFEQRQKGVLVTVEVAGLPYTEEPCKESVYGFHIHEGRSCSGSGKDPFSDAGGHFNPKNCPHPYHAGDLPPLFGNQGYAYMSVFTNRFSIPEIAGRVVIIHSQPDDFTTQPSGNSGEKIACGVIQLMQ